jgi:hypothetical protein
MKTIIFGLVILMFAGILLTSPYWLFREIIRPSDDPMPAWMGNARTRKVRLVVIVGVMALVAAGIIIAAGISDE